MAHNSTVEPLLNDLVLLLNDNSLTRDKQCQDIIKNISGFFEAEHTKAELDLVFSLLFRAEASLLHFVERGVRDKSIKCGVKEAFSLIAILLNKFDQQLSQFAISIKDVLYKCLQNCQMADSKEQAYDLLITLICNRNIIADSTAVNIGEILPFLFRELSQKLSPKALQKVYELYGAIAEHYPESCTERSITTLIRNILTQLKKQMQTTSDVKTPIVTGCMKALKGILVNFTRGHDEAPEDSGQIYKYVKLACAVNENITHRTHQRAALEVFEKHVSQLWFWVMPDHVYWLNTLNWWVMRANSDDRRVGSSALRAFHRQAWGHLTDQKNVSTESPLLQLLLTHYRDTFTNQDAPEVLLGLAIEGYAGLASCSRHLLQDSDDMVTNMFQVILQRAQNDLSTEDTETSSKHMAKYLESLSTLCRSLGSVGTAQMTALCRLAQLVVQHFPQLQNEAQYHRAIDPLCVTLLNVSLCDTNTLVNFVHNFVYQGVILTCGQTLEEEAEFQRSVTGQSVITYKNYLRLWKGLIKKVAFASKIKVPGMTVDLRHYVAGKMQYCLMRALIDIMDKLDVSYKKQDSEEMALKTTADSMKGTRPADHNVLCNLANLYSDLLPGDSLIPSDSDSLSHWLPELISSIINHSMELPLVSAFYKLLAAVLNKAENYFRDESEEIQSLGKFVVEFVENMMHECLQYKDDLLASCLTAIIAVPVHLLETLLAGMPSVLQIVFQIGQGYLLLAQKGMDALERWQTKLPPEKLKPIFQQVLPLFDPYLRSQGISIESPEDEHSELTKREREREKRMQEQTRLSKLQQRMLMLLSRVDSATCLSLLNQPITGVVAWTPDETLTIKLPFSDQRPTVCLDSMLPRVVELALNSSDRQTKAAACEVLHACVVVFTGIGLTLDSTTKGRESMTSLLNHLLPAMFRLASGSDLLARQLFELLTTQLMHWFSSKRMLQSPLTAVVLEAIFEGLTNDNDPALRDFCASSLHEFIEWSIRQNGSHEELKKSPLNIKAVVRQINSYCLHPNLSKRIGAALAFNHLAKKLREEIALVNEFWIELMYHLVCNIDLGGSSHHPGYQSLDYILKVIKTHSDLFNQENVARRVPPALSSGQLRDVLQWLLQFCASKTPECAAKCRQLVDALTPLVHDLTSVSSLVEGESLVFVCERGPSPFPDPPTLADGGRLQASLDCYIWVIRKSMESPEILSRPPSRLLVILSKRLIPYLEIFISTVDLTAPMVNSKDKSLVQTKCAVVKSLFDLLALLDSKITLLPKTFWNQQFWKLVAKCVFTPQKVGFDWRHREVLKSLCQKLRCLLVCLRDWLKPHLCDLYEQLSLLAPQDCLATVGRFGRMCQRLLTTNVEDIQYVRGLKTLYKTDLLKHVQHGQSWDGNTLVKGVYTSLFDNTGNALHPENLVLKLANKMLKFAIILGADVGITVTHVLDTKLVHDGRTSAQVTRGQHLLSLFEECMLSHLLHSSYQAVSSLLERPSEPAVNIVLLMLQACSKRRKKYKSFVAPLVSALFNNWPGISSWAGSTVNHNEQLLDLVQAAVQAESGGSTIGSLAQHQHLSTWLFKHIESSDERLKRLKPKLIRLIPAVIVHGNTDFELESALTYVQEHHFPVSCSELRAGSVDRDSFITLYQALLDTLVSTGSLVVLRAVSHAATDPSHACTDEIHTAISQFIKRHKKEEQLLALNEMFTKFSTDTIDFDSRLRVLEQFLVPMLSDARKSAVVEFYSGRIQTMIDTMEERIRFCDTEWKTKHQLVWHIGVFQLLEVLFSRVEKSELEFSDRPIVVHARTPNNTKLTKHLASKLLGVRKLTCPVETLQPMFCRLQCCAYKALCGFICNFEQQQPLRMCSVFLFKEEPNSKIWQSIIPGSPKYTFPIEFDDYPKMKKQLVHLRSLVQASASQQSAANAAAIAVYLPSQSLFDSSLNEDITRYDFSMYTVRDENRINEILEEEKQVNVAMDLEVDIINDHECMATLCGVIDHMCLNLGRAAENQAAVLPDWMDKLCTSLGDKEKQNANCRAFIVKLIVNRQHYFKPYAAHWIRPVLQTVVDNCIGDGLNYLIHDIVGMLYDWNPVAQPITFEERSLASKFLRFLVQSAPNERTAVFKYNVEVVKTVVNMWKNFVLVPYDELMTLLALDTPEPAGIRLADVFLANGILPFNQTGKSSYFEKLITILQSNKRPTYKTCAFVIGQIFKTVCEQDSLALSGDELAFFNRVQEIIGYKDARNSIERSRNIEYFIICLHQIQKNYSPIVKSFVPKCISFLGLTGSFKEMLLEILTTALDFEFRDEAFSLMHTELLNLITKEYYPEVQVAALRLVNKLTPSLGISEMGELLPSIVTLQSHKRATCRRVVYDIASWLFDNYERMQDDRAKAQRLSARSILIAGLADPDKTLQEDIYKFWCSNSRLGEGAGRRLVDSLHLLYSPTCEATLLPILVTLLLQACQLTNEFNQNIFTHPLSDCVFQKYQVSSSWRTQHALMVPMFANTLASQLTSQSPSLETLSDLPGQLRATQTSSSLYSSSLYVSVSSSKTEEMYSFGGPSTSGLFSRSYKQEPDFGSDLLIPLDKTDGREHSLTPALKRIRFVKDQSKLSRRCAEQNIRKRAIRQRKRVERVKRKEGEVHLTRDYRKGDLPDIEMPFSGFINSLQSLAKRDHYISRQLLVCITKALQGFDHIPGLTSALDHVLKTSTSHHPSLMATVLELSLIHKDYCQTPATVITSVCKNSHQMSLGALLVESKLLSNYSIPPPSKRVRSSHSHNEDWMYLAEIYHSMEEKDVVQGLFEDRITEACSQSIRTALQAEDKKQWKRAFNTYNECLNESQDGSVKDFMYEACFKCFAHLSEWSKLSETLKQTQLEGRLDDVWGDDWNKDHLMPWLFLSEVQCSQETSVLSLAADFKSAVTSWMSDPARAEHIQSRLGEYLSIIYILGGEDSRARVVSEQNRQHWLNQWHELEPLNGGLRVPHLLRLQILMDVDQFLSLPPVSENNNWAVDVKKLLDQWDQTTPSVDGNLVSWETRAVHRQIFSTKLEQHSAMSSLKKKLKGFRAETQLKTLECGLGQKNFYVAKKYLVKTKNEVLGVADNLWELSNTKCLLLRAQLEPDATADKMKRTLDAWGGIQKLQERNESKPLDASLRLSLFWHMGDYFSTLLSIVQESPSVVDNLPKDVKERFQKHLDNGYDDVLSDLQAKVVSSLEKATALPQSSLQTRQVAESYLRLAKFCHQTGVQYEGKLIESLLRAMRYDSAEARRLFPCLLQLPLQSYHDLFISESRQVAEWMFLAWVDQLLACVDTEIGPVLEPLLVRLAEAYPAALKFPFQLSSEMYGSPQGLEIASMLQGLLKLDAMEETLVRALTCVCQPHFSLAYHLDRLKMSLSGSTDTFVKAYGLMVMEAFPPDDTDKVKGHAFNDIKHFAKKIKSLVDLFQKGKIKVTDFKDKLDEVRVAVNLEKLTKEVKDKMMKRIELRSFSPWLLDHYTGSIEIPGQYTGESKPLPSRHVTMAGFKRHVKHLQSMRAPVQITVLGNDAKNHPFLIKFGEDLRQDQRVQQLFGLMNQLLRDNAVAPSSRRLYVDTYTVAPLNTRLGLIEWVDRTSVLSGFMLKNQKDDTDFTAAQEIYANWFKSKSPVETLFNSTKKEESTAVYRRAVNGLPKFLLRDALLSLAASPEAFVHLRTQMVTSHACLSVCQWLLGIGDRHLSNTLVCLDSGRLLGIDFGHAFGTATQLLPIPELMPIRLTPQLVNLAAPLYTTGLLKETMVHTLHVLRDNRRVLLATMTVFILEPSLDWLKAAQKQETENKAVSTGADWFPREKIDLARRKLEGADSRSITAEELKSGHSNRPHYSAMLALLREGTSGTDNTGLSPRQQVEALISHATNEHILSKTYYGWMPYI